MTQGKTRLDRRSLLGGAGATVVVLLVEEVEAVPPPPPGHPLPPPSKLEIDGRVSQNHGHVFTLSIADVDAATDRTYDLSGTSGHKHEVTITRASFLELQQAKVVRLASTAYGGHLHRIYARVRQNPLPPEETNVCEVFIGGKDDHELIIPKSHLEGAVDRTYDIQANSPHTHSLTIKGVELERLRKGEKLVLRTTAGAEDKHTHVVFVTFGKPVGGAPKP